MHQVFFLLHDPYMKRREEDKIMQVLSVKVRVGSLLSYYDEPMELVDMFVRDSKRIFMLKQTSALIGGCLTLSHGQFHYLLSTGKLELLEY